MIVKQYIPVTYLIAEYMAQNFAVAYDTENRITGNGERWLQPLNLAGVVAIFFLRLGARVDGDGDADSGGDGHVDNVASALIALPTQKIKEEPQHLVLRLFSYNPDFSRFPRTH